jgi:hypothetical protein
LYALQSDTLKVEHYVSLSSGRALKEEDLIKEKGIQEVKERFEEYWCASAIPKSSDKKKTFDVSQIMHLWRSFLYGPEAFPPCICGDKQVYCKEKNKFYLRCINRSKCALKASFSQRRNYPTCVKCSEFLPRFTDSEGEGNLYVKCNKCQHVVEKEKVWLQIACDMLCKQKK